MMAGTGCIPSPRPSIGHSSSIYLHGWFTSWQDGSHEERSQPVPAVRDRLLRVEQVQDVAGRKLFHLRRTQTVENIQEVIL